MSNHVTLTEQERTEVIEFWGEFFRNGGEGRQPTAFQLDAVNDRHLRDALLFWQIAGDPLEYNDSFPIESYGLIPLFGKHPDPEQAVNALTRYMKDTNEKGVEVEDLDTGSVFVLMHIMWLLLGGDYKMAGFEAAGLARAATLYLASKEGNVYPHTDPLTGLGTAAFLLDATAKVNPAEALDMAAECFGIEPNSVNAQYARRHVAAAKLHREAQTSDNNAA